MSVALTVLVALVGVFGAVDPHTVPLRFNPEGIGVVCPTARDTSAASKEPGNDVDDLFAMVASRWDYPVVAFVGIVAAAVAAATSLRRISGASTPYNLPVALALLKLPTGALITVLGLLLMRGEFIPGLTALDSSAQIIAWAVILGYAQQLFTKLVDNQAQTVLNSVGGPNNNPGKPVRDPQVPAD
jgi:delta 1-pyrroline-5-carboxylate dehydrogenase